VFRNGEKVDLKNRRQAGLEPINKRKSTSTKTPRQKLSRK